MKIKFSVMFPDPDESPRVWKENGRVLLKLTRANKLTVDLVSKAIINALDEAKK